MSALTVFLLVVLGLQLLSILSLVANHRSIPKITPRTPIELPENPPKVSVIVPARNEEDNIEQCVRSLLGQDYADFELIVVDDRSDDRTGEILDGLARTEDRLKVIHGVDPAQGWLGKNHAIYQGVGIAGGGYLLFVDADTDLDRACVSQVVNYAEYHGSDLLTIIPRLVNLTFWERLVQPAIMQMILAYFPASRINDPKYPKAASGNGPFMLFRRTAYEAIGGHEGVKADIVEDLTLARKLKGDGFRLSYLKGIELQRLR
ncbi:glycosyltransferase, partial [Thermodesulfobacteriota bacterium]